MVIPVSFRHDSSAATFAFVAEALEDVALALHLAQQTGRDAFRDAEAESGVRRVGRWLRGGDVAQRLQPSLGWLPPWPILLVCVQNVSSA